MKKFIVFVFIALLLMQNCCLGEESPFILRNGIVFGDDLETIRNKETFEFEIVSNEVTASQSEKYTSFHTYSWTTLAGIDTDIVYYFNDDGQLTELLYFMGKGLTDDEYSMLYDALIVKYGAPCEVLYPFQGMAFDFSGSKKIFDENDFDWHVDPFREDEWAVHCEDGVVIIQLVRYSITSIGANVDAVQGRLGYVMLSNEEYESIVYEENRRIKEEEEKVVREQEQKEIDLKDNI